MLLGDAPTASAEVATMSAAAAAAATGAEMAIGAEIAIGAWTVAIEIERVEAIAAAEADGVRPKKAKRSSVVISLRLLLLKQT